MPKAKPSSRRVNLSAGADVSAWPARLTQLAFVLALAVVFARGTMLESVRDSIDVDFRADAVPRGAGPAAGLVLDLITCLPALLVLVRRLVDPTFVLRWAWSHLAFGLLAACAALSTLWTADRFLALVTGAHVVAAAALLWAMAQLVRSWLRLRLVAGVCFGLLLASTAHGLIYRFVDLPDMRRSWEQQKDEILKQRGWEPGSFSAIQFERKVLNGEMIGFHVSPNAYAAVLVLLAVVSAGVAIQRFVHRDEPAWGAAVLGAVIVSIVVIRWTNSRTAMATLVWAAGAFGVLALARGWLAHNARKVYWACAIACVLGVFAVASHGVYHGGLFEGRFSNSLHFRWRYWVGAERVFEERPMLGVGWSNFGNFYLAHRLPEASEEVKDPHNFLVRAFVELGIVGGALLVAWLARMGWELTRPIVPPAPADDAPPDPEYSMRRALLTMSAVAGIGFVLNVAASVDFAESGAFAFVECFKRLLYASLLLAGGLLVAIRSSKRQELDARPAPWVLYGCLIGLGTMLLQNLIDLSLFEAGPMMIFAMVAGAAGGVRMPAA
ncbi:MAG: O-antigen ligase family protein, partial [Tepidisphaeraceae bacterium]